MNPSGPLRASPACPHPAMEQLVPRTLPALALALLATALAAPAAAQYAERPHLVGSGEPDVDASGRSIKNQRVRAVQGRDASDLGSVRYFFERDPWLAYQLGRNLNFREFRERDGIFDGQVAHLAGPMPDGATAKITANNQASCSGCHNQPYGTPGGGASFAKDGGRGRNSPHYFGAGVMEMLALQVRAEILQQLDTDRSGWISAAEGLAAGGDVAVAPRPGASPISYGDPALSSGATGVPGLNNIFRVWYVDANGLHVPGATEVDGVTTFGYDLEMVVWGWGQGPGRNALNPTNRAFLWDPYKAHGGLEAHDPSTLRDPDGDGVSEPTLAGAIQFPATHQPPDAGNRLDPLGFSRDDPDGDGTMNEISAGDLDLGEWFMLNAPRPAFAGTQHDFVKGVQLLDAMGCTECHVADWEIHARDEVFAGDRRFFDLETTWNAKLERLEGHVQPLYAQGHGIYVRRLGAAQISGLFTDLRHHEMGADFAETGYDGTMNTLWRTAPLWGVGSGFPWGHDGASLSLHDAIVRHGGEAAASRDAYLQAGNGVQEHLLDFLEKLVLYDIEALPTDVDGDGKIASDFVVAGVDTGIERFNPEWLFRVPVRIQGMVTNGDGEEVLSCAAVNLHEAYGEHLPFRADADSDGWPDVWDAAPLSPGFHDGVR